MRRDTGEDVSQYTHATQEQVDEYRLAYGNSNHYRLIVHDSKDPRLSDFKGRKNFGWLPFSEIKNVDGQVGLHSLPVIDRYVIQKSLNGT